jgi:hypothetical protein
LKICPGCGCPKEPDGFYKNRSRKDGLSSYCKACFGAQSSATNERKRRRYIEYLKAGCVDCGTKDPVVLDADHERGKRHSVSKLLHGNFTWEFLERELKRCVVRCANCHRRRTAEQFGNYRMDGKAGGHAASPTATEKHASN